MKLDLANENIIKILGIEALPDERKLGIVEKISSLVEKRLVLRALNTLPDGKRKDFENLLDSENQEATNMFLEQNFPMLGEWVSEEVLRIKQELAGTVENI